MLCPKCGYISFDSLSACKKCSQDLSAVQDEIQGTVVDVAPSFFLGAVLDDGDKPAPAAEADGFDAVPDEELTEAAESAGLEAESEVEEDAVAEEAEETLELDVDLGEAEDLDLASIEFEEPETDTGAEAGEEAVAAPVDGAIEETEEVTLEDDAVAEAAEEEIGDQEEGAIELSLDDIAPEAGVEEEPEPEEEADAGEEDGEIALSMDGEQAPPAPDQETAPEDSEAAEADADNDGIDPGSLTLDLDDIAPAADEAAPAEAAPEAPSAEEDEAPVDLEEIDLSDLVDAEAAATEPPAAEESAADGEIILSLDDNGSEDGDLTLDLDADEGESLLDLSLEAEEADPSTAIESLTDLIDLSEDGDKKS